VQSFASGLMQGLLEGATQKKPKVMRGGKLVIRDNQFMFPNGFIQISNLSSVEVGRIPQNTVLIPIALSLAIIYFITQLSRRYPALPHWLAVICMLIAIVWLCFDVQTRIKQKYGIFLAPNSGAIFILSHHNLKFLQDVQRYLSDCIKDANEAINNCIFDFSTSDIYIGENRGTVMGDIEAYNDASQFGSGSRTKRNNTVMGGYGAHNNNPQYENRSRARRNTDGYDV